jgi:hypothetical protein
MASTNIYGNGTDDASLFSSLRREFVAHASREAIAAEIDRTQGHLRKVEAELQDLLRLRDERGRQVEAGEWPRPSQETYFVNGEPVRVIDTAWVVSGEYRGAFFERLSDAESDGRVLGRVHGHGLKWLRDVEIGSL